MDLFQETIKKLDLPLIAEAYITATVKLYDSEDLKGKLSQAANYAAYNVSDEICGKYPGAVAFQNIDGNTSLIISGEKKEIEQNARQVIDEVYAALTDSLGWIFISASDIASAASDIFPNLISLLKSRCITNFYLRIKTSSILRTW